MNDDELKRLANGSKYDLIESIKNLREHIKRRDNIIEALRKEIEYYESEEEDEEDEEDDKEDEGQIYVHRVFIPGLSVLFEEFLTQFRNEY